jgi:RNA polymerase sigma-70 factor, ECF subfamily
LESHIDVVREKSNVPPQNNAVEHLYRENRQRLFTCAMAITRRSDRAEDAVQEAFCRLVRMSVEPENLKAYVFRAVRNAAIDQQRKNGSAMQSDPEFIFDPQPNPCEAALAVEFRCRAAEALQNLPPDECETIVEHLYGNLSFREIAEIREAPLGTVTAWYRRGLEKLRTKLEA